MKVTVKLFGTLSSGIPGYDHAHGLEVDLPEGAIVNDLMVLLEISERQKAVVAIDGRIRKGSYKILSGACAQIFQPMHGG